MNEDKIKVKTEMEMISKDEKAMEDEKDILNNRKSVLNEDRIKVKTEMEITTKEEKTVEKLGKLENVL